MKSTHLDGVQILFVAIELCMVVVDEHTCFSIFAGVSNKERKDNCKSENLCRERGRRHR